MNFDAVVWHGTQMTNLPSLPGAWSSANGVNDRGQVVGESVYVVVAHEVDAHSTDVESLWHAALWTRT